MYACCNSTTPCPCNVVLLLLPGLYASRRMRPSVMTVIVRQDAMWVRERGLACRDAPSAGERRRVSLNCGNVFRLQESLLVLLRLVEGLFLAGWLAGTLALLVRPMAVNRLGSACWSCCHVTSLVSMSSSYNEWTGHSLQAAAAASADASARATPWLLALTLLEARSGPHSSW